MDFPKRITIEFTNRCNRECKGCPRLKIDYPLGDMSLELLNKIVEQIPNDTIIVPFFRGESLIHPKFIEMIKLLKKFDKVQIATNGDLITSEKGYVMLDYCSFISFSLHKFCYPLEKYEIAKFLKIAKRTRNIQTQVSIVESFLNIHKKDIFIKSWLRHVDRVRIYAEHSKEGFGDVEQKYKIITEDKPCKKLLEDMVIYWDGNVALCNHDWNNSGLLGNVMDRSIESIWNGEKYREIRLLHSLGFRTRVESCRSCDYWMLDYMEDGMFGELYENE